MASETWLSGTRIMPTAKLPSNFLYGNCPTVQLPPCGQLLVSRITGQVPRTGTRGALAKMKKPSRPETLHTLEELGEAFRGNSVADLIVRFVETEDCH